MRYRLNDIEAFLLVMETGGLTSAGLRINRSKSVISKRISDLEDALGIQLLHRSTRGVVATERGQLFYDKARDLLLQLEEAANSTAEEEGVLCGQVRISAPMTFGRKYVGPMLFGLMQQHPGLDLVMDLDDRNVEVDASGYDLALRVTQPLNDMSLIARKLGVSRRVVCCSPEYAQRYGLPASLDELIHHRCIGYAYVASGHMWQFEPDSNHGAIRTAPVRPGIVLNNRELICDAAIAGLGICLLPYYIAGEALLDGRLMQALPDSPTSDTIYALYQGHRFQSPKVRFVLNYLKDQFSLPLPWEN